MSTKAEKPKKWKYDELSRLYANTENQQLGKRLMEVLNLAKEKGSLIKSENYYPSFGLRGKFGKRIMSFWSPEKHHCSPPGSVHLFINPKRYTNTKERDNLLEKLNKLLYFSDDLYKLNLGKTSGKSLADLTEVEFSTFIKILEIYSFDRYTE